MDNHDHHAHEHEPMHAGHEHHGHSDHDHEDPGQPDHHHVEESITPQPAGHAHGHGVDHTGHEAMFRQRFWVSTLLSVPVLLFSPTIQGWLGFSMAAFPGSNWVTPIFAVIVFAIGGIPFLRMASPEIRTRRPGMMTLISLAIAVAFFYSLATRLLPGTEPFFWELVTLIDVMLLGHWLETRSVRQASGALDQLAKLLPDTAERLRPDGTPETVAADELAEGDLVLVRPGASIPADGEIVEGETSVNEAMITGESRPVSKTVGEPVIAGTINGDGSLRVQVTATGKATALAGIMRLVEAAQSSKSQTQLLADRAAGWLFYVAIGVAAITGVAWLAAVGLQVDVIARVATVLVIACPHALGLAIPLVVAITTALGAENGVLIRNRLAMEQARQLDMVVFDKTGTLTKGEFEVQSIQSASDFDEMEALALAAAVEADSEHTIAQAVRKSAETRGTRPPKLSDFEALKGRGVRAHKGDRELFVGGPRLLQHLGLSVPGWLDQFAARAGQLGQTLIYLIVDREIVAGLALADGVRPESRAAIDWLKGAGVGVAMLTGDSQAVAGAIAAELGIDRVFAEVLPEDKEAMVKELQHEGKRVAMVGDGVNDAPALARADVGIAIGSGTDVAIESADIVLVKSDPFDVAKIVKLSRASYRKMLQNLVWATGYNVIALPLAAGVLAPFGVLLSPAVGAIFMSLSTVIVAINAQLLRRVRLAPAAG